MLCTFCGTENRLENKFCGMCGVKLERRKMERRVRHGGVNLKCGSCGQINEPGNAFCGMCGARVERRLSERRVSEGRATAIANVQLPSPEVPEMDEPELKLEPEKLAPEPRPELPPAPEAEISPRPPAAIFRSSPAGPSSISGPSFLGLSDAPGNPGEYLLEEERSSGNTVRTLVFIAVLAAVLGLGFLQWRSSLRASPKAPAPPKIEPAVSLPQEQKQKSETPSGQEATSSASAGDTAPGSAANNAAEKTAQDQVDTAKPSVPTAAGSPAEKTKAGDERNRATKKEKEKAPEGPPSLQRPSGSLLKAQDYLQGRNGVKQDCDQGLTYLRAAVQKSEPAAAIQMGELYASGHCVQQDRVMAYRWMNSARELAPGNSAIQTTLDQLWARMTPQERKDAGH